MKMAVDSFCLEPAIALPRMYPACASMSRFESIALPD
jgi:hypothetical protein